MPDHLLELHKQAVAGCQAQDQEQELAERLRKYQDVREAIRRPNMMGAVTREKAQRTEVTELTPMLEHRAKILEQLYKKSELNKPTLQEKIKDSNPGSMVQDNPGPEIEENEATENPCPREDEINPQARKDGCPSKQTRPPVRYGEHVCHSIQETNNLPQARNGDKGLDEKKTWLDVAGKEMKGELKLRDLELRQPLIDVCNWLDPQPTNWRGACGGWRAAAT